MLELKVTGEKHPKTFTLVTDDSEGELARLQEIFHDEVGADADDPMRQIVDNNSAEQFAEGVELPTDQIGEWEEILEGDWPDAAAVVAKQREDNVRQLEEAAAAEAES